MANMNMEMEAALEAIINRLLSGDNEQMRQGSIEIIGSFENPQTFQILCQIICSHRPPSIRQFSAILLKKRFGKLRNWNALALEQRDEIKVCLLQALMVEKEKIVRIAIAQIIGVIVRHEQEKGSQWMAELIRAVFEQCASTNPIVSEMGTSIFSTLVDAAPDHFVTYMEAIFQMFSNALVMAESQGNLATTTIGNILASMSILMPFVCGNSSAEQTVSKAMPLILNTVHSFALKNNVDEFSNVIEIMDSIAEYVPRLLSNHIKTLVELFLTTANNKAIDVAIRVQLITYIGQIIHIKKKTIVKQKLLVPIVSTIFEIICNESGEEINDDFFSDDSGQNAITACTQALDLMALHMPADKLIPPLLELLEPALQSPDPFHRRSSFLCMAVIAEGCSDTICTKYLEPMLNIIKNGIQDNESIVRVSAFYALGQFSEHLHPNITKYAPHILPIFFKFLQQLVNDLQRGDPEPKHIDRMFYALETYCETLDDDIVPHLELLMNRLFDTLDPRYSVQVRQLGLSAISSVAKSAKEHIMPYFSRLVNILQNYLVKECEESFEQLRIQAIDTLASVARVVGKDNFVPLATDTINYCLLMLEDGPDDPDIRRSIYNLTSALSNVVNENMSSVFPKIIDRIIESVISSEDMTISDQASLTPDPIFESYLDNDIDLTETDDEDDEDDDDFQLENDYVMEKEEAILALKEFAVNSGTSFAPYLQTSFENVYKVIDHPQESIRMASVEAIVAFIILLNKMGDESGVRRACEIALPKFANIIRNDKEQSVVIHSLDLLGEIFKEVGEPAVPSSAMAEIIFKCIKDVLLKKVACQFNEPSGGGDEDDPEDSEYGELLNENASNLLPQFGHALKPEVFSVYFERLYKMFINKLNKAKKIDSAEQRAFYYGVLADCFESVGKSLGNFIDILCPVLIDGMLDTEPKARQNSYFAIGELVLVTEEISYSFYPNILNALSNAIAKEQEPAALDNICGAVARMIVTNYKIIPLDHVLPVFIANLPLREDTTENSMIYQAFRVLYSKARPSIVGFIEQMLAVTIHVLYKKEFPDRDNIDNAVGFIKEIGQQYPDKFNTVINANADVYNFVQSL